jgi:Fe2+ or Zn2+ uptake regulation protein
MWRTKPLLNEIIEILRQRKETPIKDEDLFDEIKKENPDISYGQFLKALLSLEVRGMISVSLVKENMRVIVLMEE